jgi:Kef-type K+ transport system membrane component KefB
VNPLLFLMGLLLLAYMGSFLTGDRRIRGFGLPSGAEYLLLGFLLGPSMLGLVDRSTRGQFDPIAHVALGWIALVIGLGFGVDRRQRTRAGHVAVGAFVSAATAAGIAAGLWFVVTRFTQLRGETRFLLVAGCALTCAETTRESVRWVAERYGATGKLSSTVSDLARSDDIIPLSVTAFFFAWTVNAHLPWPMHPWSWALMTLGLGVVLGGTAALLIGRDLRTDETWGTLLGLSVLGVGIATRLGLSAVSAMFAMGLATAVFSGQRQALLAMAEPTERTVLHPVLLLAGARVDLHATPALGLLVAAAIVTRVAGKVVVGLVWQAGSARARTAGPLLGMGLLSAGTLCMTLGLAFSLRFPGVIGDTVLATAAAATVFGEFVGPFALRASLRSAGEVPAPGAQPATAAP